MCLFEKISGRSGIKGTHNGIGLGKEKGMMDVGREVRIKMERVKDRKRKKKRETEGSQ